MLHSFFRRRNMASALGVLALLAVALPGWAFDLNKRQAFAIKPQPVISALLEFAQQAQIQVMSSKEEIQAQQSPGVNGEFTLGSALEHLLAGTGLRYRATGDGTILVTAEPRTQGMTNEMDGLRVAQNEAGATPDSQKQQPSSTAAAGSEGTKVEEIVVTAQKREERLQDVPISISVLTGEELDKSAFMGVTDALRQVPGVSFQSGVIGGLTGVFMRGVVASNIFASGSALTAYYLDTLPFSFVKNAYTVDPDVYDLERIEVLRGPQGTLYGASALNGVVRVLTHDADLDQFEFKARGSTSSTEEGSWNYRGDMAVNVPIVEGKLAARAVLGYQDWSGWIDRPNQKDANDAQRRNARLKINAQPTDALSIGAFAWMSQEDYGSPAMGQDSENSAKPNPEPSSMDFDAFGLKIGYEFPGVSLTSSTSYLSYENFQTLDLAVFGLPFVANTWVDARTFSQEVNLNSARAGAWRWSVGGMYRDSRDESLQLFIGPIPEILRDTSKSYALFGELTRSFLDGRLELTGGLRHFEDEVDLRQKSSSTGAPPDQLAKADATFTATTPRGVLTWHPKEQMSLYASYGEGFRSGLHQAPAVLLVTPFPPVQPDKLKNYEIGAKGSLGRRFSFDSAFYYMDWNDAQISTTVLYQGAPYAAGVNSKGASGVGVDLGVTARPVDALELGVNFSWNDLTLDGDVQDGNLLLGQEGERLSLSPEYTGHVSADYTFPVGANGIEGRFSVSTDYTSATVQRYVFIDVVAAQGDPLWIARTSLALSAADHWTATLFVDNLNDERSSPQKADPPFAFNSVRVRPRTIGVQLEYRW